MKELIVVSVVNNKLVELGVVLEWGLSGCFLETSEVFGDELREVELVLCEFVFIADNLQLGEAVVLGGEWFLENAWDIGDSLAELKLPEVLVKSLSVYVGVVLDVGIEDDVLLDGVVVFYQVLFFAILRN